MFTAHDVDCVLGENVKCDLCPGVAEVCIAGVNLCGHDADLVYPGWKEYLPSSPQTTITKKEPCGAIGLEKAPNVPMLGF